MDYFKFKSYIISFNLSNFTFKHIHDKCYWQTDKRTDRPLSSTHTHEHGIFTCIFLVGSQLDTVLTTHLLLYTHISSTKIIELTKSFTFLPFTISNWINKSILIKINFLGWKICGSSSWLVTTNLVISNQNVLKLLQAIMEGGGVFLKGLE